MSETIGEDRSNQELVIDVLDFEGVRVVCDAQRWAEKIDANHPELSGKHDDVPQSISEPEMVLQDRDYGARRHHVRRSANNLYTMVVVEYRYSRGDVTGHLVTAFVRQRLRADDEVLYVKARR